MRNSQKARAVARVALTVAATKAAIAYEQTRKKPEDAMAAKTATQPGVFARMVQKVAAFFRRLVNRRPRQNPVAMRSFGTSFGTRYSRPMTKAPWKLYRKMMRHSGRPIPMATGKARRKLYAAIRRAA